MYGRYIVASSVTCRFTKEQETKPGRRRMIHVATCRQFPGDSGRGLDRLLLLATKDAAAQGLVDGRNKCAYSPWKDTAKIAEAVLTVYHSIVAPEPARNP